MKLGTCMVLGGVGAASLAFAASLGIQGCSSSSSSGGGSTSGAGANPPASPTTGTTAASTTEITFAVHELFLGDGSGAQSWQQIGYNIDGLETETPASRSAACTPSQYGTNEKLVNGQNGIDNSFGENIVPLLGQFTSSSALTADVQAGKFTVILDTKGLTTSATQSSTGLFGQIFFGLAFGQAPNSASAMPSFNGTDVWPVSPSNLTSTSPPTSSTQFTAAWVNNGVFVSGAPTSAQLALTIQGVQLTISISHAVLTFTHSGANATNGIISGVIDANSLVTELSGVAGNISSSLCTGSAFDTIKDQILAAADILDDGSNKPGTPCTGISIGLGFQAEPIAPPSAVGVPAAGTNPCADAGSSGGEDAGTD